MLSRCHTLGRVVFGRARSAKLPVDFREPFGLKGMEAALGLAGAESLRKPTRPLLPAAMGLPTQRNSGEDALLTICGPSAGAEAIGVPAPFLTDVGLVGIDGPGPGPREW